jgi:hypothetical protein
MEDMYRTSSKTQAGASGNRTEKEEGVISPPMYSHAQPKKSDPPTCML